MSQLRLGKYFMIQSRSNCNVVLEMNTSFSSKVQLGLKIHDSSRNEHQLWTFNRKFKLKNKKCSAYLYAEENLLKASRSRTDENNFQWNIFDNQIISKNGSRFAITNVDDQECLLKPIDDNITQQWIIEYQPAMYFYIQLESDNSLVFDVKNDNIRPGAKVILYKNKNNNSDNQLWWENKDGIILSKLNNYALDASNREEILLQPYTKNENQQWTFQDQTIKNIQLKSKCLDMESLTFYRYAYPFSKHCISDNCPIWKKNYINKDIPFHHSGIGKYFLIKSEGRGMVFEVEEGNQKIKMAYQNENCEFQQFYFCQRTIRNASTKFKGLVLEAADNGVIFTGFVENNERQKWKYEDKHLINMKFPELALQANASGEGELKTIADMKIQYWNLTNLPAKGFYIFTESCNKVLDVRGDNVKPGARITIYKQKTDVCPNQLWYEDENSYIRSMLNGFVMDSTNRKIVTALFDSNNVNQQWTIDGEYIRNHRINMVADVNFARTINGTSIIKYLQHDGSNQKWRIEFV